ncbi:BglII/BstYI family type II restriction endonuclease [Neobacillus sp. NPDC093182]|uniref:BglII/BstYI family type II restriction endonuclease n=1 Tax=Neobacillus sp. NPDC093182 TaxID=3364297 RepID=UPI00381B4463
MKLRIYSHNSADNILLQEPFYDCYKELIWVCENTPLSVYKNKSNAQAKLDIVQQIMDSYLNVQFKTLGWDAGYPFRINDEYIKLDYLKEFTSKDNSFGIHLEVEFGNVASSYRNYFKLQLVNNMTKNNIGIIILPTESLSKRIDSGVATFEKTINEISFAKYIFNFPLLIIGLDDNGTEEINLKNTDLSLKELQNKANIKHELFVLDYINSLGQKSPSY